MGSPLHFSAQRCGHVSFLADQSARSTVLQSLVALQREYSVACEAHLSSTRTGLCSPSLAESLQRWRSFQRVLHLVFFVFDVVGTCLTSRKFSHSAAAFVGFLLQGKTCHCSGRIAKAPVSVYICGSPNQVIELGGGACRHSAQ